MKIGPLNGSGQHAIFSMGDSLSDINNNVALFYNNISNEIQLTMYGNPAVISPNMNANYIWDNNYHKIDLEWDSQAPFFRIYIDDVLLVEDTTTTTISRTDTIRIFSMGVFIRNLFSVRNALSSFKNLSISETPRK